MTMNLKCVSEWDRCLPQPDELTPLSQKLIPHELACAFNILPSSSSSTCTVATPAADVLNASHSAFKSLLEIRSILMPSAESERERDAETVPHLYQNKFDDDEKFQDIVQAVKEGSEDNLHVVNLSPDGRFAGGLTTGPISFCSPDDDFANASLLAPRIAAGLSQLMYGATYSSDSRIPESTTADLGNHNPLLRDGGTGISGSILEAANLIQLKLDPSDDTDSIPSMDFFQGSSITVSNEEQSARIPKKPRLVWTPQLHKRFVDAVAYLGIKQAVPKTIMQRMNVDGLTRENVASHLQKYRLYLKRAQGFANGGPSISDQLFASTPVPPSLAASPHYLGSHHSQQVDYSFGSVHNANLQSHLGHPAHQNTSSISSPTPPFAGFNCLPSFSMIQRAQVPPPLINSELGRENYIPQRSSAQGQVLSLFPNSSK